MTQESRPPGSEANCHICGGKLMFREHPPAGGQQSVDTICTECGREDGFSWSTLRTVQREQPKRRGFRVPRIGLSLFGKRRRTIIPGHLSSDGSVDIARLLEEHSFPVYGLAGRPGGLRLKGPGFGKHTSSTATYTTAYLNYVAGHPLNPDTALELTETDEDRYQNVPDEHLKAARTEMEFETVSTTVRNNSSEEQGKRWFHEGEFHRVWNLDTAAKASHETLEIEIMGEKRTVEVGSWAEPFNVRVLTFAIPPVNLKVCSLNLSRQDTVEALKTLRVLQGNDQLISDHRTDVAKTRKLIWPDR